MQVFGYRAPCFSITQSVCWAYQILEELGFQYDSSVNPIHHGFYGNAAASRWPFRVGQNLLELPIATWRVLGQNVPVGGGAYLRILPYGLMKWAYDQSMTENADLQFYICTPGKSIRTSLACTHRGSRGCGNTSDYPR